MVSTFSRPLKTKWTERIPTCDNSLTIRISRSTQLFPHSPSMNSKLWQVEMNPWLASSLDFQSFHTDRRSITYIPFVSETFRKLVTSPRNWTLPHDFSKITRETQNFDASLDRSTRASDDDHFLSDSIINYVTFNYDRYRCITKRWEKRFTFSGVVFAVDSWKKVVCGLCDAIRLLLTSRKR